MKTTILFVVQHYSRNEWRDSRKYSIVDTGKSGLSHSQRVFPLLQFRLIKRTITEEPCN